MEDTIIIDNKTLWSGRFMDVRLVTLSPETDGTARIREMAVRKHRVVCVIARTPEDEFVFIRQLRVYFCTDGTAEVRPTIEFVAGKVGDLDPDETLSSAAERELEEETGYRATKLIFLFKESVSAGILGEERFCFYAPDVVPGLKEDSRESDRIETILVPAACIDSFIRKEAGCGIEIDSGVRSMLYEVLRLKKEEHPDDKLQERYPLLGL